MYIFKVHHKSCAGTDEVYWNSDGYLYKRLVKTSLLCLSAVFMGTQTKSDASQGTCRLYELYIYDQTMLSSLLLTCYSIS